MQSYKKKSPYKARRKPSPNTAVIKKVIRQELKREDRKDHPLEWADFRFSGEYVKTTPLLLSFNNILQNQIAAAGIATNWPVRVKASGDKYYEANVYVTGYNYQLRYQQNAQAESPTIDTVRELFYSFDETITEDGTAILSGADIDQPPNTKNLSRMYSDRVYTLRAAITETDGDDSQFVAGQHISKGWKKLNHKFTVQATNASTVNVLEGGDIRLEMQSDDSSIIGEVQVYGFVRLYFRIMD